jgi:hypothetical protein
VDCAICDDVDLGLEVFGFIELLAAVQQACRSVSGKSRRVVDGEVDRRRRVCDCSDRLGLANALAAERSRQPRPVHERSPSEAIVMLGADQVQSVSVANAIARPRRRFCRRPSSGDVGVNLGSDRSRRLTLVPGPPAPRARNSRGTERRRRQCGVRPRSRWSTSRSLQLSAEAVNFSNPLSTQRSGTSTGSGTHRDNWLLNRRLVGAKPRIAAILLPPTVTLSALGHLHSSGRQESGSA